MALDWGEFYHMTINYLDYFHEKHPTKTIEVMMFREPLVSLERNISLHSSKMGGSPFFTSKAATPCPIANVPCIFQVQQ